MITINATGDTTLHTAGKYCPEDILVKVPAGGSGSGGAGAIETSTVTITTTMQSNYTVYITACIDDSISVSTSEVQNGRFILENAVVGSHVTLIGDMSGVDFILSGMTLLKSNDSAAVMRIDATNSAITMDAGK